MKNKRCSASQVLKFPSPQKLKKRILNGRECKSTLIFPPPNFFTTLSEELM
jgi:hypothetical protein